MIIDDFKSFAPNVDVEPANCDRANMNAEPATGFASGNPADVLYLADLIHPAHARQGPLQDMRALAASALRSLGQSSGIKPCFSWTNSCPISTLGFVTACVGS